MSNKGELNFGIDAPPVIRVLAVLGLVGLVASIMLMHLFAMNHSVVMSIVTYTICTISFICFIEVVLMFYSSRYGKLRVRDRLINQLDLSGCETVLDLGCGRGLLLIAIAKKLHGSAKVYGLDLWEKRDLSQNDMGMAMRNIKIARVEDKVVLKTGDMSKMPFDSNMFDLIVSSLAIHNLPTPKARARAISEIHRALKPGGKIVLLDFQYTNEYKNYLLDLGWAHVSRSKKIFRMFPPVNLITGSKPLSS